MNTIDKQIEILQAFKEGKTIERLCGYKEDGDAAWNKIQEEVADFYPFNFESETYRIKQEPKLRPYKNAEEFVQALKGHGIWLHRFDEDIYFMPLYCNTNDIILKSYNMYDKDHDEIISFATLLKLFVWQDGTPCGIMEE